MRRSLERNRCAARNESRSKGAIRPVGELLSEIQKLVLQGIGGAVEKECPIKLIGGLSGWMSS